ncbi:MAG: hypothetical protein JO149_09570, partial [Gammaproteobacteria bacterium]|nr:hypothetical protein [Gammaproteobacteria bacterium]
MMDMLNSKKFRIKDIISRSLIISSLATLAIALIGSVYFNYNSVQVARENNLKREKQLLSNFLIPAIAIADTMEVRRLLTLASSADEKFVVIDSSRNILIPNYDEFNLIKKFYIEKSKFLDCSMVKTG